MAPFTFKVKTKTGQHVINSLTASSTFKELKVLLASISGIQEDRLLIRSGFPPKPISTSDVTPLNSCNITHGDTVILEESSKTDFTSAAASVPAVAQTQEEINPKDIRAGILMKHVVPADNSCLFASINFVLNGKVDESGSAVPWMRNLIAEVVSKDPETYSDAILGKENSDYCKWIKDDTSWGGGIELSILSTHYGIEIAVVDIANAIINQFGEDQDYGNRVFLLFDGIHYDPLFLEAADGSIRTIFPKEDEEILTQAEELAKEAKASRNYTDVNKFTLRCLVCNIRLTGQAQAQTHAKSTGHANFDEL